MRLLLMLLVGLLALPSSSCTKAPPNLSPAGQEAFQKTRVIKALDLLRDFAIDAEAAQPQALSTDTTRKIVRAHQGILKIMNAAGAGWQRIVASTLDDVVANLSEADQHKVSPYVALVKAILLEVQ